MSIFCIKFLLISLACSIHVCYAGQDTQDGLCPPWFFYNTTTKTCECYSSPSTDHIVRCTEKEALLKLGYCMTYERESGFHVGVCKNVEINSLNITTDNYIRLPNNVSDLNDYMCIPMNRKGPMCSQCTDGFGLAVFSIGHPCANCTGVWYGIPLYLFIEFVPITLFYFIVIFFHINVTSAPMVAFVVFSQIAVSAFSTMVSNRIIFDSTIIYNFLNILISFYGIWNLDFFRFIIPPFCVSSHIKPTHVNFLYFISAFYPLCLIAMSWMAIHLYSRNFKLVIWLWNRLKQIFCHCTCFDINRDATKTMIDVFATFFLLSYAKLVFASLRTLNYGISLNLNNISLHESFHVYSDPSTMFFGKEHLPFAITSVFIFLFVVLPVPLLLALYPFRSIRTVLFKCPIGSRTIAAINIFVQKFYSCYRDKTEGRRDMRSLVSIYFFLRLMVSFATTTQIPRRVSFSILVFIYIASTILIALAQPYKQKYMNITDTLILANLAMLCLILSQLSGELHIAFILFYYVSGSILASLPLLGLIGTIVYKIIRKLTKLPCCKRLLHSHGQHGHNDIADDDQDLEFLESREDPELKECTVNIKEQCHEEQHLGTFYKHT